MTGQDSRRLVAELNTKAREALAHLTEVEEANRTTVVNRALCVYREISDAQREGKEITIGGQRVRYV